MAIKAKITSTNSQGPQKVSVTVPASGGTVTSVTAIGDLTDVIASTLPDGAVLQYATASGNWTSRALIDDDTFPSATATATSLHSGESIRNFILSGTSTLTNKTIDLDANTLTGTITEFNSALQSADFATLANVETFTNKTLTQPKIAEIDSLSTGGITLDADTDIVLDADGADIILKDGGSEFGRFTNSSGELVIKSSSSATTALTMSGSNVTVAGNLTVTGNATANGSTITLGDAASDTIAFGGTITGSLVFEGSTNDSFETTLTPGNPSADVTVTLPAATDTLVGKATTDTLTNKSIDLTDNTLSGTIAEFNTALSDGTFVTIADNQTLTNKTLTTPTINKILGTNITLDASGDISLDAGGNDIKLKDSGTVFGQLTNRSGELVIKSSSSATSALTFSGANVTAEGNFTVDGNLTVSGSTTTVDSTTVNIQNAFVFEGGTDDSFETTLTTVDPTADRTISLPNATGTIVLQDTSDTLTNKSIDSDNNTITNIVNADIKAAAGIAFSKMEDLTASRALVSDGNGDVSISAVTSTEIGHLDGVSDNIQTQLDTKATSSFAIAQAIALG